MNDAAHGIDHVDGICRYNADMLGSHVGQLVGIHFGQYLGRQIALGACRDDDGDDVLGARPFRPSLAEGNLPSRVDLRPWMTTVEEQGSIGSCTANALAGALEYLLHREHAAHVDLSRLFIYFNQRLLDDRVREDTGASISSGIRVLSRVGVPREASWPYQRDLFAVQPTEAVFAEASRHRVLDWWNVPVDSVSVRACLAAGFPIVFGTRVTESFVATPRTGFCGMPSGADDRKHGRHAMLLVGYDHQRRLFFARNSWGDDWGDRGYVYMPYDYLLNRSWTPNAWAIRLTARDKFDFAQPPIPMTHLPRAGPEDAGSTALVGTVANIGAQTAVRALTGSSLLAGLAGGLLAGVTPSVARAVRGRDRGVFVGRDRSEEILASLRGADPAFSGHAPMPWDDGFDEEAARAAGVAVAATAPPALPAAIAAAASVPAPANAAPSVASRATDFVARLPSRIAAVWREAGGRSGGLGAPISEPVPIMDGNFRGTVVRFEHGAIIAPSGAPDAAVAPPVVFSNADRAFARWVELGAGRSVLGWPLLLAPVAAHGRVLWCTRGAVFDRTSLGVFAIHGTLFAYWQQLGGLGGSHGLPLDDQVVPDDPSAPQSVRLDRATLYWSAARGVWTG